MHPAHYPPQEPEYLPANSALDEFDDEGIEAGPPAPTQRALPKSKDSRVFTVVEQYEPADIDTLIREQEVGFARRPGLRLLRRLAMTAVLVAIPSGTPVDTEGLPRPVSASVAPAAQWPPASVETRTLPSAPTSATSEPPAVDEAREPRSPERKVSRPAVRAEVVSPPSLESLREAFAGLNGPFMSFEHCEVRLASADRAVARCQGVQNAAPPEGTPARPQRVEWTLEFDRTEQRWQMVDAAAR